MNLDNTCKYETVLVISGIALKYLKQKKDDM